MLDMVKPINDEEHKLLWKLLFKNVLKADSIDCLFANSDSKLSTCRFFLVLPESVSVTMKDAMRRCICCATCFRKGSVDNQNFDFLYLHQVFFKVFKDPIRVPRIENRVPRIRESDPYGSIPGT